MDARAVIRAGAGVLACLVLGWFAFVRGTRVPLLGGADLGFHELGHLLASPFPDVFTAGMGSVTQVLVPLVVAGYFLWRREWVGAGVCLAWAATSAQDASVYIADAPFQRLPLIGGEHDWAFVLGPQHLNMLGSAGTIAGVVKDSGVLLWLAGISLCGAGPFLEERHRLRAEAAMSEPSMRPSGWAIVPPWEEDAYASDEPPGTSDPPS